jgi:hypothetical protein
MSQALASARKRRAPIELSQPTNSAIQSGSNAPSNQAQGLTLPQVIALVDKRLTILEQNANKATETSPSVPSNITEVLDEYGSRFDIIADELASIKNMLLSLQSFTMDVNKTLMQDRIRTLADISGEESGVEASASH